MNQIEFVASPKLFKCSDTSVKLGRPCYVHLSMFPGQNELNQSFGTRELSAHICHRCLNSRDLVLRVLQLSKFVYCRQHDNVLDFINASLQ